MIICNTWSQFPPLATIGSVLFKCSSFSVTACLNKRFGSVSWANFAKTYKRQSKSMLYQVCDSNSFCNHARAHEKCLKYHTFKGSAKSSSIQIHSSRSIWDLMKSKDFGSYDIITRPGNVSSSAAFPDYIQQPPYAKTGIPGSCPPEPEIKTQSGIEKMKKACQIATTILQRVADETKVGMSTEDINRIVNEEALERCCYPSPLNYRGFPKSVCTSVNNVACHGVPDDRPLQNGDIVSVDITVYYMGHHGDCCTTLLIGDVDPLGKHLVKAAKHCRDEAVAACAPGVMFSTIGTIIEEVAAAHCLTVVPAFVGHGIGTYFHGPPDIYHVCNDYPGKMEAGMTFTVEPVLCQGSEEVVVLEDGWTSVMLDNGRAAQFEHTVLITLDGHEILTVL